MENWIPLTFSNNVEEKGRHNVYSYKHNKADTEILKNDYHSSPIQWANNTYITYDYHATYILYLSFEDCKE